MGFRPPLYRAAPADLKMVELPPPVQAVESEFGRLVRFGAGERTLQYHAIDGAEMLTGSLGATHLHYLRTEDTSHLCTSLGCERLDRGGERVADYEKLLERVRHLYRAHFWSVRPAEALHRLRELPVQRFSDGPELTYIATDGEPQGNFFALVYTPPTDGEPEFYDFTMRLKPPEGLLPHVETFVAGLDGVLGEIADSDFGAQTNGVPQGDDRALRRNADGTWILIDHMQTHARPAGGSLDEFLGAVEWPDPYQGTWMDDVCAGW